MESGTSSQVELDALQETRQIASSLIDFLNNTGRMPASIHSPMAADMRIPSFSPLFPEDILDPLESLPVSPSTREALRQRFRDLMGDLRAHYSASYRETCLASLKGPTFTPNFELIKQVYLSLFTRRCLPMVQSRVSRVVTQVASRQRANVREVKPTFNHQFTPVLEKYFELNGYPSIHHRDILARESGMTPRQIEVWFQNHRSRAKKEGIYIRRSSSDLPLKQALLSLSAPSSARIPTPPCESLIQKQDNKGDRVFLSDSCIDAFDEFRPPHAFPATKSSQHPDPFANVFKFPPPIWLRKPATTPIVPTEVDVDILARTFHMKLNFVDDLRGRNLSKSELSPFKPWFASKMTVPSSAPHPARIQTTHVPSPDKPSLLWPLFTESYSFALPVGSNTAYPSSSAFLCAPSDTATKRKIRRLPRRNPSTSTFHASRSSSCSSDTSSTSTMSSSVQSSPEPLTPPPLSPTILAPDSGNSPEVHVNADNTEYSSLTPLDAEQFDFSFLFTPFGKPTIQPDFVPQYGFNLFSGVTH